MRHFILLIIVCTITFSVTGQQDLRIKLSKLKSCEILIKINPVTLQPEINLIDSLRNVEIVWFVVGSRNSINLSEIQRVAVFQTEVKEGKTVVFLMPKDRVTISGGKISGVYPNWDLIKGLRYYNADCFYETIKDL